MGLFLAVIIIIAAVLAAMTSTNRHRHHSSRVVSTYSQPTQRHSVLPPNFDSENLPASMPEEERDIISKVASFCGKRFITSDDLKKYSLHQIDADFQAMEGWREWDASIHEQPGQYKRLQRGIQEKMRVVVYDGRQHIAKVSGSTGRMYIASFRQCSCPDFRARNLPCKHMYNLCVRLEGHPDTSIGFPTQKPFFGLQFALAGRFGSKNDPNGIRARINNRGGTWTDTISKDTTFLVCGTSPSKAKVQVAQNYGVPIMTESEFDALFADAESQNVPITT